MHGLAAYRDAWMLADLIISIVDVIIVIVVRITVMAMQTTYIKLIKNKPHVLHYR